MSNQSDFKILSDRDHILMRAGMYIGSTSPEQVEQYVDFKKGTFNVVPGLLKIINEIIDNSVDEAIRTNFEYGTRINIVVDRTNNTVSVSDNGRGIPVVEHDGIYQAEASWTRAKAGTSFTDDRTTIGTNGVGSFATNCFSKTFVGESSDGTNKVTVKCSDNCNPDNITTKKTKSRHTGTTVSFEPDLHRFNITSITDDHVAILRDRLVNIQICYPKIQFTFNSEKIKTGSLNQIASKISTDALPVSGNTDNFKIIVAPSGDLQEFGFVSYVNGLNLVNGGTHIDFIISQLCNELRPLIKRKWKIDVVPNQIKQHLFLGIWVPGFVNPKFDSQSKERLTNTHSEISSFFSTIDFSKIAKKIINTENIIGPMIESILYKKQLAERRAAQAALKSSKKIRSDKHIAATNKDPEQKAIYLAEGLSALSSHLPSRDPTKHGGYALRGKVMNTHGMKNEEIALNKELAELLGIIGLDLYSPVINEEPTELYEINYDGTTYIVSPNDSIITADGTTLAVSDILST